MAVNTDNRNNFDEFINSVNILNNDIQEELILSNSFNIINFKTDFNNFIDGMRKNNFDIHLIFYYYNLNPKFSLSYTLFNLIRISLSLNVLKITNKSDKDVEEKFITWFKKNYNNNLNEIIIFSSADGTTLDHNKTRLNSLIRDGIFTLYNKIIKIDTLRFDDPIKSFIKELSIDINKYYFLTEILLKILLDTENNNNDSIESRVIQNNFDEYSNENGFDRPLPYYENQVCYNSSPKVYIRDKMKILMRQIYYIINGLYIKFEKIDKLSSRYNIVDDVYDKNEVTIQKLYKDKINYNHINKTLDTKYNYIENNKNKEKIIVIIVTIITILFIIFNLYISLMSPEKSSILFQLNISVIVIIFITKFYYLFK